MFGFVVFDAVVLLLIIVEFWILNKFAGKRIYELAVVATIAIYRLTTWIGITLGLHFEELGVSQWRYDHKWIGLTIIGLGYLLWPKTKYARQRSIILGIGMGQILDEISEWLMLFGVPLPLVFRDSALDLGLIFLSTSLFLGAREIWQRRNGDQRSGDVGRG